MTPPQRVRPGQIMIHDPLISPPRGLGPHTRCSPWQGVQWWELGWAGMETERVNYWITMSRWEWEYKLEIKSNKVPRMEPLSNFSTLTQWQHNGPKLQHNFYIEFNLEHLRMASKMYTCNFSMKVLKVSDCTKIALLKINHLLHQNMHIAQNQMDRSFKRLDNLLHRSPIIINAWMSDDDGNV